MILFCQLDVTGRSEDDPAAGHLVRNLLASQQASPAKLRPRLVPYSMQESPRAWSISARRGSPQRPTTGASPKRARCLCSAQAPARVLPLSLGTSSNGSRRGATCWPSAVTSPTCHPSCRRFARTERSTSRRSSRPCRPRRFWRGSGRRTCTTAIRGIYPCSRPVRRRRAMAFSRPSAPSASSSVRWSHGSSRAPLPRTPSAPSASQHFLSRDCLPTSAPRVRPRFSTASPLLSRPPAPNRALEDRFLSRPARGVG